MGDPPFFDRLKAGAGFYAGRGMNHERENFIGSLAVKHMFGGVVMWFCARGDDGQVFHEEIVLLGADFAGGLTMSSLNNNVPVVQCFGSEAVGPDEASFITGDFANDMGFRERVVLRFEADGAVTYRFEWGMQGEAVAQRSAVTMAAVGERPVGCPFAG